MDFFDIKKIPRKVDILQIFFNFFFNLKTSNILKLKKKKKHIFLKTFPKLWI